MLRAAVLGFGLVAVALGGCNTSCGGQCSAPYQMNVVFRAGTTPSEASSVLQGCRRLPTVISISPPQGNATGYHSTIETRTFGGASESKQLESCLHGSPSVLLAVFPD